MENKKTNDYVENGDGYRIGYDAIRQAMQGTPFRMELVGAEARVVEKAVNIGIDSHLEACFCPDRGDRYQWHDRKLHCLVTTDSFPTLIRRLFEIDGGCGSGQRLADDMLHALGFDENGNHIDRKSA